MTVSNSNVPATASQRAGASAEGTRATGNPFLAALLAWIVPGAGHLYLGRWGRAAAFLGLVLFSAALGCLLQGRLFEVVADQPLSRLGTFASMGMGIPYFLLRLVFGYHGDLLSATYEYGSAFLLTAGLMNLLVVLDAWDIAHGRKS